MIQSDRNAARRLARCSTAGGTANSLDQITVTQRWRSYGGGVVNSGSMRRERRAWLGSGGTTQGERERERCRGDGEREQRRDGGRERERERC
jgi:hypothetical protein